MQETTDIKKTLIGVLASHDSPQKHAELVRALKSIRGSMAEGLKRFHFVFTGGTFDRLVLGSSECTNPDGNVVSTEEYKPDRDLQRFLLGNSTRLPDRANGGLVLLSNLVIHHQCELLWMFLSPDTPHWVNCQNMALLRLSDSCFAKKYMNGISVLRWSDEEAGRDVGRCPQGVSGLRITLGTPEEDVQGQPYPSAARTRDRDGQPEFWEVRLPGARPWDACEESGREHTTVALIAHDVMKPRMVDFATQYERELGGFRRIITTGTTGTEIGKRCHELREKGKLRLCQSGPYGGDLEIAAEILAGRCQVVVFFVDPLHAHPHTDDIRAVFSVCMQVDSNVLMLSNELHAREWFDTLRF